MESFVHLRKGTTPKRLHADLDGLKDDELGRGGFTGRTANMYRRHDPTAYRGVGPLRPVDVLASELKPERRHRRGTALPCCCSPTPTAASRLSRRTEAMPFYVRHVDGDLLSFVHEGPGCSRPSSGRCATARATGSTSRRHARGGTSPTAETHAADDRGHRRVPGAPARAARPALPVRPLTGHHPRPGASIDADRRPATSTRFAWCTAEGGPTTLYYQHNPLDVEGWRGDNFPFTFNIADYNVVTSASVHLPPTVHLFMQATGVYVMNFLPKPAEGVPGTERTPWYHRNVDYDEIAFFHGGSLYGIPMPPGLISHAPQGVHHGAPEKARERARRKFDEYDKVDWQVIAIDTRRRLVPSAEVLANDLGQH